MAQGGGLDERWERLAEILTGYSASVRRGDRVLITMVEPHTYPLVRALHASVVRAGGYPQVELQSAELERDLLLHGDVEQIGTVPELSRAGLEWADVSFGVRGSSNPFALNGIRADRIASRRKAMGKLSALRTERTRWVLVRVPEQSMAQQAGLSLDEMMESFFDSVLRDWELESRRYRDILLRFAGASTVRLVGPGTDLSMSTAGRTFLAEDGHINMPGGELYTSPVEDSAEGTISFSYPGVFAGRSVPGMVLELARGRVVSARARENQDLLDSLLAMDQGASRIGEIGIGLNSGLTRSYADPLLDEKILGTAHIALGRSYAACGGLNQSSLHWDVVTDLRQGRIEVDGKLVFRDGAFLP